MDIATASTLVHAFYFYVAVGIAFAAWFVPRGIERLDPRAASGSLGFRAMIFPGVVALWPWLLFRLRSRGGVR